MVGLTRIAPAAVTACVAGAINAVSGGGTLLTFPVLIKLGVPAIRANATSTVALWPGVLGSIWGYRKDLQGAGTWRNLMMGPSLIGGLAGALLLISTRPAIFSKLAPFLVLAATLLFMSHSVVSRFLKSRVKDDTGDSEPARTPKALAAFLMFQFIVAVYGGYFGAGIGILMLASLGIMGFSNIHRMNGLKAFGAFCINGVAVIVFVVQGVVDWQIGVPMAAGGLLGGYLGARVARLVGQTAVRWIIIAVGFTATVSLLLPQLRH
ncbi:MAG: sulfite exporter TauE/SafE family protein [Chloroflexi bacterium]|nr:sulfite exporter TauE/SafE family protein [Chloroflexota bacterium]